MDDILETETERETEGDFSLGIREGVSEEVTFELGLDASGGGSQGEGAPGRGHSKYNSPEI